MDLDEQIQELNRAKDIIESVSRRIYDFRAPALRINEYTIRALEETGFTTDISGCVPAVRWTAHFRLETEVEVAGCAAVVVSSLL